MSKYDDRYMISDIIKKLEKIKETEGDIPCVVSEDHDYWGSVQSYITDSKLNVGDAQPDGPKSGKSVRSVIVSYS